jgi:DNA-binding MarR family transcriptional regulator
MESDDRGQSENASVNSAGLIDGLLRVSQIVRLRFNDWLGQFNLTDGRHAVLAALARAGEVGCSQAELADRLGQSESNISTLIERMQRDGLVDRSRSVADRRKRVLRVTSAGLASLESVDAKRTAWSGQLLSGIPTEECPKLLTLLQRLGESLEPSFAISPTAITSRSVLSDEGEPPVVKRRNDPTDDPRSPQFALRQMLLELSSSAGVESHEKDAA